MHRGRGTKEENNTRTDRSDFCLTTQERLSRPEVSCTYERHKTHQLRVLRREDALTRSMPAKCLYLRVKHHAGNDPVLPTVALVKNVRQ